MRQKQKQSTYNKLTNLYENSFVICGGKLFNSLPKEIRNSEYQVEDSTLFSRKLWMSFSEAYWMNQTLYQTTAKELGL